MKMEPIVSSETSAIRTQTPGNYQKRNKLHIHICLPDFEAQFESVFTTKTRFLSNSKSFLPDMTWYLRDLKPCLSDMKTLLSEKRSRNATHCTSTLGFPSVMLITLSSCYTELRKCVTNPADASEIKYFFNFSDEGCCDLHK